MIETVTGSTTTASLETVHLGRRLGSASRQAYGVAVL
jgi:hypothetical protein